MTTKHTPGPWGLEYDYSLVMPYKRGNHIVTAGLIGPDGATSEEKRANMQLISASPEMLDALEEITKAHLIGMGKSAMILRIELCLRAIAKAKGERFENGDYLHPELQEKWNTPKATE